EKTIVEKRSKTPQREFFNNSKVSTPKLQSKREHNKQAFPLVSSHFFELYQNDFNLDDHIEMRRKYHNSSQTKQRSLKKSHSYTHIKSFSPERPFNEIN